MNRAEAYGLIVAGKDLSIEAVKDRAILQKNFDYLFRQIIEMINDQTYIQYLNMDINYRRSQHIKTLIYIVYTKMKNQSEGYILKYYDDMCEEVMLQFFTCLPNEDIEVIDEAASFIRYHLESLVMTEYISEHQGLPIYVQGLELMHLPWLIKIIKAMYFKKKPKPEIEQFLTFYQVDIIYPQNEEPNDIKAMIYSSQVGLEFTLDCLVGNESPVKFIYLNLEHLFLNYPEQRLKLKNKIYRYLETHYQSVPIHLKMPSRFLLQKMMNILNNSHKREVFFRVSQTFYEEELACVNQYDRLGVKHIIIPCWFNESIQKTMIKEFVKRGIYVDSCVFEKYTLLQEEGLMKFKHVVVNMPLLYENICPNQSCTTLNILNFYYDYIASYKNEVIHYRKTLYTYLGDFAQKLSTINTLKKRQMTNMIVRKKDLLKFEM